jgi:hypothetical protein
MGTGWCEVIHLRADGPYRSVAVDDFGRTVATAIRNLYGWSLIARRPELHQTTYLTRPEAEHQLLVSARFRLALATATRMDAAA